MTPADTPAGARRRSRQQTRQRHLVAERIKYHRAQMIAETRIGNRGKALSHARNIAADSASASIDSAAPPALQDVSVGAISDGELLALLDDPNVRSAPAAVDVVVNEMDRRDMIAGALDARTRAAVTVAAAFWEPNPAGGADRVAAHRARLWDAACQLSDSLMTGVFDGQVVGRLGSLLDASFVDDRQARVRADWAALCLDQMLRAKQDCPSGLVSAQAQQSGVTAWDLWTRPDDWVCSRGTAEFLEWRRENPPITFDAYVAALPAGRGGQTP